MPRLDLIPSYVVFVIVAFMNVRYAVSHDWEASIEWLGALLLVGGYTGGRTLDMKRNGKPGEAP
jgi:hypothetical protein